MQHPNIVKLYEVFQDDFNVYLVLEYIEGESLLAYLKKQPKKRCSVEQSRVIFRQVISGITYCHQYNIAHRDIKLENVIVCKTDPNKPETTNEPRVKIIDFGFAYQYEFGEKGDSF